MKNILLNEIYQAGYYMAYARYAQISRVLSELEPDKPEDNTQGFLAYNVPDKARMKMKTGRFLTRKLNLNSGFLPDTLIQKIASAINESLFPNLCIRLDKGIAITENYENEVGGSSCMTGSNSEYTRLYERNPDRFQQLVIEQNGDSARAIIHKLDGGSFMIDRIYATCEYLKDQMKTYAEEQGWKFRESGTISGLEYYDNEIPYMDTFNDYRIENGLLTIGTDLDKAQGSLESTCGVLENGICCEMCERHYPEDDIIVIDDYYYCINCVNESFTYCESCEECYSNDDMTHIVDKDIYVCSSCAKRFHSCCEDCHAYTSETVIVDGEKDVCQSCAEEYYVCDDCGDYVSEITDGLCGDCTPEEIVICGGIPGELFNDK